MFSEQTINNLKDSWPNYTRRSESCTILSVKNFVVEIIYHLKDLDGYLQFQAKPKIFEYL